MKKTTVFILAVLMAVLTACSGGQETPGTSDSGIHMV